MRVPLLFFASAALAAGCIDNVNGRGAATAQVRSQASSDLDCPDTDVRVSEELGGRYKAIGCGRKKYYRTACDGLRCVVQGDEGGPFLPIHDRPDPGELNAPK